MRPISVYVYGRLAMSHNIEQLYQHQDPSQNHIQTNLGFLNILYFWPEGELLTRGINANQEIA